MTTLVRLRMEGVDFADERTNEQLALLASDVGWSETDGIVLMTVYADDTRAVDDTMVAVLELRAAVPSARALRLQEELVSTSDIANRVGVSREAARKWASESDFPPVFATVGGGDRNPSKVWAWPDIVAWLKSSRAIDMDEKFLTPRDTAILNARLVTAQDRLGESDVLWLSVSRTINSFTVAKVDAVRATSLYLSGEEAEAVARETGTVRPSTKWSEPVEFARAS